MPHDAQGVGAQLLVPDQYLRAFVALIVKPRFSRRFGEYEAFAVQLSAGDLGIKSSEELADQRLVPELGPIFLVLSPPDRFSYHPAWLTQHVGQPGAAAASGAENPYQVFRFEFAHSLHYAHRQRRCQFCTWLPPLKPDPPAGLC